MLDGLIQAGHVYFVRQSYFRGMKPGAKESLLISHYRSAAEATAHYDAILTDQRRYIYDISNAADKEKLYHAATQPEGYAVYIALLKDKKWKPGPMLTAAVRRFVRVHASRSQEGRTDVSIRLFIRFGELFLTLKQHKQEEQNIPLSEIEKT